MHSVSEGNGSIQLYEYLASKNIITYYIYYTLSKIKCRIQECDILVEIVLGSGTSIDSLINLCQFHQQNLLCAAARHFGL